MIYLTLKGINSLLRNQIVKLNSSLKGGEQVNKGTTPTVTGQRIRELIRRKHMTEAAFAESIGIKPAALSAWIRGKRNPNAASLEILAANLNTTVDYLQGRTDMPLPFDELLEKEKEFQVKHPEIFLQATKNDLILKLIELLGYDSNPVIQSFDQDSWEQKPGIASILPDVEEYIDCKCNKYLKRRRKRKNGSDPNNSRSKDE